MNIAFTYSGLLRNFSDHYLRISDNFIHDSFYHTWNIKDQNYPRTIDWKDIFGLLSIKALKYEIDIFEKENFTHFNKWNIKKPSYINC